MDNNESIALKVRSAAKFFGTRLIFKNVSCDVHRGEILLVVGRNGAGKTTLLKIMSGLSRPSAGSAEVLTEPEKTAYLGHSTFIYPRLSGLSNLSFWASMYGLSPSRDELMVLLQRVGLERAAEEEAGAYSRGMAQRLNLARVFLVNPDLLFLDEPGTGLDQASLTLLREEVVSMRDQGTAIVWISHDVNHDTALADRVLGLAGRKMAYLGEAADFDPQSVLGGDNA
ncbi:ABC transporter ATP-binding protein [Maridesulfovibrio hydrothermalis]|uniref:ABC transporter related n=1 Tax=Maridesulfovibrio hydrothermalis AM13 = DSM 14728 TaxID=1121451 RepID=L0R7B9_9BACT|nr:ABC transporter ATP-binding protein [Maridesulfovibrio hydrothermalis]CCO22085.1 ABC transporter related [Maridesulfovibrio hydrothermalis AM13 = DSM 14728]